MSDTDGTYYGFAKPATVHDLPHIITLLESMEDRLGIASLSPREKAQFVILFSGIVQKRMAEKLHNRSVPVTATHYQRLVSEEIELLISEIDH